MQLWHFLICDIAQRIQKGKSCPMRWEGSSTHRGLLGRDGICNGSWGKSMKRDQIQRNLTHCNGKFGNLTFNRHLNWYLPFSSFKAYFQVCAFWRIWFWWRFCSCAINAWILISIHPLRAAQSWCCCNTGKGEVLGRPIFHSSRSENPEEKLFRGMTEMQKKDVYSWGRPHMGVF